MGKIKVKLVKSTIGCPQDQKDTVKALGLKKLGAEAVKDDSPAVKGMVSKVKHLLQVEEA